jgi:hypothetical protein
MAQRGRARPLIGLVLGELRLHWNICDASTPDMTVTIHDHNARVCCA